MADTHTRPALTHEGALRVLRAAIERAKAMETPQCIAVADPAGQLLAFVRMDGAKFLSIRTAQRKAMTAANRRTATGGIEPVEIAFEGTALPGYLHPPTERPRAERLHA